MMPLSESRRTDYAAQWEQSPELKKSVTEELANWGRAYRGGYPRLGYPKQAPYYTPPRDARDKVTPIRQEPDPDKAQITEDNFVMWRLIAKRAHGEVGEHLQRLHDIAVMHYVKAVPMQEVAKRLGVGRRDSYRLRDEMLYRYWVISRA